MNPQRWLMRFAAFALAWWVQTGLGQAEQAIRFAAVFNDENVPIKFFGLCLDQDGQPIPGVQIKMGVRQWRGVSRLDLQGIELAFDRVSDKDGRFELSGVNGDVAGVDAAQKEGYDWVKKGSASVDFWGKRTFVPSANEPFVLYFWKRHGAEPLLVRKNQGWQRISPTGTPVTYDLKTGAKVEQSANPTVRFSLQRNPDVVPKQSQAKFDWMFTVEVPGGGVQLTQTNMPFLAPADGYGAKASFGYNADDPAWRRETNAVLFYKTAQGQYGRLEVNVMASTVGAVAGVDWASYLNPAGSPVLEYEYAKQLKAPSAALPVSPNQPPSVPPTRPQPANG
ncbi:MAG: hypothetical protein EBS05_26220, partial [Proteobacteria bacterium]|nr:hypothetical protein [Pseudomonadota bacterium]